MSIYGEGAYVAPSTVARAEAAARARSSQERRWELRLPRVRRELRRRCATSEDKPLIPTSVYAVTKRDHEELCLVVGAAYGIRRSRCASSTSTGPGQALSNPYTGVAAIFASRLLNGNAPLVFEDGLQSRDFIHVDDIVAGIVLALESDEAVGQAVNLGTGRR